MRVKVKRSHMGLQWIRSTDPEDDTAPAEPLCSTFTPSDVYRCSVVTGPRQHLSHTITALIITFGKRLTSVNVALAFWLPVPCTTVREMEEHFSIKKRKKQMRLRILFACAHTRTPVRHTPTTNTQIHDPHLEVPRKLALLSSSG